MSEKSETTQEEAALLAMMRQGAGRTWALAARLRVPVPVARKHLRRMERAGLVQRNKRFTAVNCIYWEPTNER